MGTDSGTLSGLGDGGTDIVSGKRQPTGHALVRTAYHSPAPYAGPRLPPI